MKWVDDSLCDSSIVPTGCLLFTILYYINMINVRITKKIEQMSETQSRQSNQSNQSNQCNPWLKK